MNEAESRETQANLDAWENEGGALVGEQAGCPEQGQFSEPSNGK